MDNRGAQALNGVSFDVHAGEVLGIAGVQGNGQTELVEVLTGLRVPQRRLGETAGRRSSAGTPARCAISARASRRW